jgi:hypothetical protein
MTPGSCSGFSAASASRNRRPGVAPPKLECERETVTSTLALAAHSGYIGLAYLFDKTALHGP